MQRSTFSTFRLLSRAGIHLRPHWPALSFLLLVSSGSAVLAGAGEPLVLKSLVDSLSSHQLRRFLLICLLPLVVFVALRISGMLAERLRQRVEGEIARSIVCISLRSFLNFQYPQVITRDQGYFTSRIYDEPMQVTKFVGNLVQMSSSLVAIAGSMGVSLWLSWKLAVCMLVLIPVVHLLGKRLRLQLRSSTAESSELRASVREYVGRTVAAYKTVNMFGLYETVFSRLDDLMRSVIAQEARSVRQASAFRAFSGTLMSSASLIVLIGSGFEVLVGRLTIGGLFAIVSAYGALANSFQGVLQLAPELVVMKTQLQRVVEFTSVSALAARSDISSETLQITDGLYEVDGKTVWTECQFIVKVGDRVLVRGPNGCGKTTLAHVLTEFLPLTQGHRRGPTRERISAMLTPFFFIPGNLSDNLSHTQKRALQDDLLVRMDLQQKMNEDPSRLSEGEKRKLQIVMTLLKEADFYIFDEPLANVDSTSSDMVMETILSHTREKGLLVIMHGWHRYESRFDRCYEFPELLRNTRG